VVVREADPVPAERALLKPDLPEDSSKRADVHQSSFDYPRAICLKTPSESRGIRMQTHGASLHLSAQYALFTHRWDISPADLSNGWQGSGIFAISSACRR
jgi:hypothetical protein